MREEIRIRKVTSCRGRLGTGSGVCMHSSRVLQGRMKDILVEEGEIGSVPSHSMHPGPPLLDSTED